MKDFVLFLFTILIVMSFAFMCQVSANKKITERKAAISDSLNHVYQSRLDSIYKGEAEYSEVFQQMYNKLNK